MAKELVCDELWEIIEPLLPPEPPKPQGGRPRVEDRAALSGITFVLKCGIPWEMLPQEMGCGSGVTCWRRLREWQEAGVSHSPKSAQRQRSPKVALCQNASLRVITLGMQPYRSHRDYKTPREDSCRRLNRDRCCQQFHHSNSLRFQKKCLAYSHCSQN